MAAVLVGIEDAVLEAVGMAVVLTSVVEMVAVVGVVTKVTTGVGVVAKVTTGVDDVVPLTLVSPVWVINFTEDVLVFWRCRWQSWKYPSWCKRVSGARLRVGESKILQ